MRPGLGPFQPERRQNPPASRRLVLIVAALVCLYVTGVFVYAESVSNKVDSTRYKSDLHSCQQRRQLQIENNRRAGEHKIDARNLTRLASALTHTRQIEARAFFAIGEAFHIRDQVSPLVSAYRLAASIDESIKVAQEKVHFDRVVVVDCKKEVPKP